MKSLFGKVPHFCHKPIPHSWYREMWVQHPAQNNLFPFSPEMKTEAIKSFIGREKIEQPANFAEWLKAQYGQWLYDNLFEPYNRKYWCVELECMSTDWLGARFYLPSVDEVLFGSYSPKTENTYYAKEMRYPEEHGFFGFIKDIVGDAEENKKLYYNSMVLRIKTDSREIWFSNEKHEYYDEIKSSIPLTEMVKLIDNVPEEISKDARELEYTSVALVSFGFSREVDCKDIWFYIYDTDILPARAFLPGRKASSNVPDGASSIQFEIYFNEKTQQIDEKKSIENCIYALKKMNIATERDIDATDFRVVRYANIIFKKNTRECADRIIAWLRQRGIQCIGRFGEWKYYWSDQSFMSGYDS